MRRFILLVFLALIYPFTVCAAEMTVSGAASLANAFDELKQVFERANPGLTVNMNYAASNPLLRQIVEGAPVDVFAAADQETMDKAAAAHVIDPATRRNFTRNDLVLIVPKAQGAPKNLAELSAVQRIAIGNPDSVPAGRYARAALQNAGLWEKLKSRYVYAASVRQALDYVARGEVDAGFVYATDAKHLQDRVDVAMIVSGHDPVAYPIAVSVTGNNPEAGQQFLDFVLSDAGQTILSRYGFAQP